MKFSIGDLVQVGVSNGRTKGTVVEVYAPVEGEFEVWVEITKSPRTEFMGNTYGFYPYELEKI
jgi:hypothetical protein